MNEPTADTIRVLLVGNFLSLEGATRQPCEELARKLKQRHWKVIRTSARLSRPLRFVDMLRTVWLRRGDYDVAGIDVFSGPSFVWAYAVGRMLSALGKPHIITLHGGSLPEFSKRWPRAVEGLLGGADAVTAPSGFLIEKMAPYCRSIQLIPNPIELGRYSFRTRTKPQPSIVWLRAFHSMYDPSMAVRVFASVTESFPNSSLAMVGPDKGDGSLWKARREAGDLGVSHKIEWTGPVDKADVPAVLSRHDIFLNTSRVDNAPVTVIEAMACGLCVVTTDAGGIPDLVQHEHDALVVPVGDADAMAAAVTMVLEDAVLAARLSTNGRRTAQACDWTAVLPRWEALLCEVAAGA